MARAFQSGIDLLGQLASAINANLSSGKLLGRSSAGSGSIEEISIGSNLTLSGGVLSAAASGVNGYVAGNWVLPYQGTVVGSSSLLVNVAMFTAFTVQKSITVNGLGARVATASSLNNIQLAVYASGTNRLPTGTPLATTGNLSTGSNTTVSSAVTPFALTAGEIYWGGVNASGGTPAMMTTASGGINFAANVVGNSSLASLSTSSATIAIVYYVNAVPFGTWPDVTSSSKIASVGALGCAVFLQVASVP